MQKTPSLAPDTEDELAEKLRRDRRLATMFKENERIWQVAEYYNEVEAVWRMDFVRQGFQGRWMIYRYLYDVATGVIYFMGTRPIEDEELLTVRRSGKIFDVAALRASEA